MTRKQMETVPSLIAGYPPSPLQLPSPIQSLQPIARMPKPPQPTPKWLVPVSITFIIICILAIGFTVYWFHFRNTDSGNSIPSTTDPGSDPGSDPTNVPKATGTKIGQTISTNETITSLTLLGLTNSQIMISSLTSSNLGLIVGESDYGTVDSFETISNSYLISNPVSRSTCGLANIDNQLRYVSYGSNFQNPDIRSDLSTTSFYFPLSFGDPTTNYLLEFDTQTDSTDNSKTILSIRNADFTAANQFTLSVPLDRTTSANTYSWIQFPCVTNRQGSAMVVWSDNNFNNLIEYCVIENVKTGKTNIAYNNFYTASSVMQGLSVSHDGVYILTTSDKNMLLYKFGGNKWNIVYTLRTNHLTSNGFQQVCLDQTESTYRWVAGTTTNNIFVGEILNDEITGMARIETSLVDTSGPCQTVCSSSKQMIWVSGGQNVEQLSYSFTTA